MLGLLLAAGLMAQPVTSGGPLGGPLSGPRVAHKEREGIVQTEMSGRVRRPETLIEQAALDRLALSTEVRARVDKVLVARAAGIDRFVTENFVLLGQAQTVGAAGTVKEKVTLFLVGLHKISAAVGGQSLKERIAAELPSEDAQKFRAMLREYWKAVHVEAVNAKPHDPPPAWATYLGESLGSLGQEIARSFQRQESSGTLIVDYLTAGLDLTEKQQEIIREMKLEMMERTGMKADAEEQKKLAIGVAAYLNEKQRDKLMERIVGK